MEAGTNPNIASPVGGDFVREILGRSPLSKWVYSNTCQAAKRAPRKRSGHGPPPGSKPGRRGKQKGSGVEKAFTGRSVAQFPHLATPLPLFGSVLI
jgi:hypothetical protein